MKGSKGAWNKRVSMATKTLWNRGVLAQWRSPLESIAFYTQARAGRLSYYNLIAESWT